MRQKKPQGFIKLGGSSEQVLTGKPCRRPASSPWPALTRTQHQHRLGSAVSRPQPTPAGSARVPGAVCAHRSLGSAVQDAPTLGQKLALSISARKLDLMLPSDPRSLGFPPSVSPCHIPGEIHFPSVYKYIQVFPR